MPIRISHRGNFSKFDSYCEKLKEIFKMGDLDAYGHECVQALISNTPKDSGETARSWYYQITREDGRVILSFHNDNVINNVPIAIILQYGHGTGTGGYVQGRDYINPAVQPVFDRIAENAWKEVKDA